jgi:hypothetical protein
MFWKRKNKKPEPFSFQTLTDDECEKLIRCLKDEFREMIKSGGEIEKKLKDLQMVKICDEDELKISYRFTFNLPMVREMIKGLRA